MTVDGSLGWFGAALQLKTAIRFCIYYYSQTWDITKTLRNSETESKSSSLVLGLRGLGQRISSRLGWGFGSCLLLARLGCWLESCRG